jgi:hypothetical protein
MSLLDFRETASRIPIRSVLWLLGWAPSHQRGHQWRGPGPLPDCSPSDKTPRDRCFCVDLERHIFCCFRCGRSGNQLDLWTHATGLPLYPATLDLCRHLAIPPIYLRNPQPRNHT